MSDEMMRRQETIDRLMMLLPLLLLRMPLLQHWWSRASHSCAASLLNSIVVVQLLINSFFGIKYNFSTLSCNAMLCCVGFEFIFSHFWIVLIKYITNVLACTFVCSLDERKKTASDLCGFEFFMWAKDDTQQKTSLCSKFKNIHYTHNSYAVDNECVFDSQCIGCLPSIVRMCV